MKKEWKIKIHSIIDVITNSSTEIYIQADSNTIEKTFELFDIIIKASGSDKSARELFDLRIELGEWDKKNAIESFMKSDDFGLCISESDIREYQLANPKFEDWQVENKLAEKYLHENGLWNDYVDDERYGDDDLIVKLKDSDEDIFDLASKVSSIFHIDVHNS